MPGAAASPLRPIYRPAYLLAEMLVAAPEAKGAHSAPFRDRSKTPSLSLPLCIILAFWKLFALGHLTVRLDLLAELKVVALVCAVGLHHDLHLLEVLTLPSLAVL
jgi:hypothetical protein